MKRKLSSLSQFNYRRRCPILKENARKNDLESSSDEDEDISIPNNPSPLKKLRKNDKNCTIQSVDENQMYSSQTILDSSSGDENDGSEALAFNDKQYRLDVLKGIFKDEFSDEELFNAINDTNGLDHAVSVLIDLKDEKGESGFVSSSQQSLKKRAKGLDISSDDETPKILDAPEIQNDVGDNNDCIVVKDNDELNDTASEITRSTQAVVIASDESTDENCGSDDDDCNENQDLAIADDDKSQILSLFDAADPTELALVRGCSLTKAKQICGLRPFASWKDLLERVRSTKGLGEWLLWECETFVKERDKISDLMDKCEHISKDMKETFEVISSENLLESEKSGSVFVTKEQYITKEPTLIAPGLKLKSYQLNGLNWLIAIHQFGLNGILADEMGLGKTIQAIVFLAYLIEQGEKGPHLIIVPSSTCDNWKREFKKWCPSIECFHYAGSQSERAVLRDEVLCSMRDFQILITTYSMATVAAPDRIFLKKLQFHYAIFDEAHMLKNMKSQRYQQLLRIKPQRMLMLTGTPIQNNILELMSLLTFVMPDMFAQQVEGIKLLFGDNKVKQKGESAYQKEKVIQAKRIMQPFVLRRVKKDVLGNSLPDKQEHLVECDVPSRQRKVYNENFNSFCKIMRSTETKDPAKGFGLIIELRKAANHSLLIRSHYTDDMLNKMAQNYCKHPSHRDSEVNFVFQDMQVMSDFELSRLCLNERCLRDFHLPDELIMDSGKFIYLDSILPKMKENGDRVLLFNQFVMMMDIVEVYLKKRGYKYLRFDGSTSVNERQGLIDRFNNEPDIFIFLLSTKAGGLGINLTSANVVILYDSDYNPHNDKQAEDRCHRLGQTRDVNIYRLVCKDTIEKTILKCANDKIRLHEDISGNQNAPDRDMEGLINAVFGSSTKDDDKEQ
ncbi:SWI/SNF-related matrix-associated actin-dependent regulator of chromatin subfamily A containing DEAD/H box 1-like [Dendronephthya gigantea]|uniref:SWI/SNF-related matrix-associated actin-dependent regulator of chromatin subfamily A containing DEAD/H box 1-like n=1 Tax=Dendronephthya gigantea TaxID=151771 RepID=UPI00106C4636|nr:SWI/SNF-related matrix-associated actin-dependent regulator of chromatin subfamily A containing DEAD/H box 1-like [Dendronephthya gigantea]XP_028409920.1 SWI/SNF-related matrix-associated actin-dependent regulator of chromatin subfamily A containing DEAD/H box 1-like [Dendronephthya gigantea]